MKFTLLCLLNLYLAIPVPQATQPNATAQVSASTQSNAPAPSNTPAANGNAAKKGKKKGKKGKKAKNNGQNQANQQQTQTNQQAQQTANAQQTQTNQQGQTNQPAQQATNAQQAPTNQQGQTNQPAQQATNAQQAPTNQQTATQNIPNNAGGPIQNQAQTQSQINQIPNAAVNNAGGQGQNGPAPPPPGPQNPAVQQAQQIQNNNNNANAQLPQGINAQSNALSSGNQPGQNANFGPLAPNGLPPLSQLIAQTSTQLGVPLQAGQLPLNPIANLNANIQTPSQAGQGTGPQPGQFGGQGQGFPLNRQGNLQKRNAEKFTKRNLQKRSPQNQNQAQAAPQPGQAQPGAQIPTSVANQFGDASTQFNTQTNANAITAIRNFLGDQALVSNAINLIGSGTVTDPATISRLAQVAFNAEVNENDQRLVMAANSGGQQLAQEANNNLVTFTPTVLNGLQAIAQNPTQNAQQIAQMMGTVRNARILPSIGNLATTATGGSIPLTTIIQMTTQLNNAQQGPRQDFNSATLAALINNGANGQGQQQQQQQNAGPGTVQQAGPVVVTQPAGPVVVTQQPTNQPTGP